MKYSFTPRYPGYLTQAEAAYASGVGDPYQFSIILRQYRGPIEWTKADDLFPENPYRAGTTRSSPRPTSPR